jgi:hypothetical protein
VFTFNWECRSQVQPGTSVPSSAQLSNSSSARQIELLLRSQFSIPPDYDVILGTRATSDTAGFDTLPVTLIHEGKKSTTDFLISKDGNTLARLAKFDLKNNPALSIDITGRPVRGNPKAKVQIINFDDLECPYCAMLNSIILPKTLDHYKGLIKIVYKDFPIEGHPWATRAAVDASCLASMNPSAYWTYVDYVHNHMEEVGGTEKDLAKSFQTLDNIASKIGTQNEAVGPELEKCLKNQDQSVVNGERLPAGARPTSELWPAIDRALRAQGIEPPPQPADKTSAE